MHQHCYGNSCYLETNQNIKFDHGMKRWCSMMKIEVEPSMRDNGLKRSTPMPEKLLRASISDFERSKTCNMLPQQTAS